MQRILVNGTHEALFKAQSKVDLSNIRCQFCICRSSANIPRSLQPLQKVYVCDDIRKLRDDDLLLLDLLFAGYVYAYGHLALEVAE